MRRFIVPIIILVLIGGGVYFYFFMWDDFKNPPAKTPTEAIDRFREALKKRDYKAAAKYCTKDFAEQMLKAAEAAEKVGKAIDDLTSRMTDDKVITAEMEYIIFQNDPFPGNRITITLLNESGDKATASFKLEEPRVELWTKKWPADPNFIRAFYNGQPGTVNLVKEGKGWKLDFKVTAQTQASVNRLKDKHGDYANAFTVLSGEIKRDATTKEAVKERLFDLLTSAVKAEK